MATNETPENPKQDFFDYVQKEFSEPLTQKGGDPSKYVKAQTFFEKNGNSNKYNWSPEFAEEVLNELYNWYISDKQLIMYTSFARENLHMTYKNMVKKLQEFSTDWEDTKEEMDLLLTERLAENGLVGRLDKDIIKICLKHLGQKWQDKDTLVIEGSVENALQKAYIDRINKQKENESK